MTVAAGTRFPSFRRSLVANEVALALGEVTVVGVPALGLLQDARASAMPVAIASAMVVVLMGVATVLFAVRLAPVARVRAGKQAGLAITQDEAAAAQASLARAPLENAVIHTGAWLLTVIALAAAALRTGAVSWQTACGVVGITLVHGAASGAARGLALERVLDRMRRASIPNFDPLRVFAQQYAGRLARTSLAVLGAASAVVWALAAVFARLPAEALALIAAWPAVLLVAAALLWRPWLARRTRAIERYLDVAVRHPGARGPARDDPAAVAAFRAAQSLPYTLAAVQAVTTIAGGVAVVLLARARVPFDGTIAARLVGAIVLVAPAGALYQTLILRDVLRPLLGQLGARHRLPAAEVRSPLTLRAKLVGFFFGVTSFSSGLVLLLALSPATEPTTLLGAAVLGAAIALGLLLLVLRDVVRPIRELELRSDEMARGELARPVPPAGEADEIGRLTFAFEEMRRALRDKLRSTESLNVDLEREVQRRTEVLEQRNKELNDALEQLRRAQDELVRTEKLASVGRLVAGIAHEINNPVNAVINTLAPLDEHLRALRQATDPAVFASGMAEAEEMLAVIQRGAARTKAIVQALHNYSRSDEQTLREVNLVRSIDDTVDILRHRLKGIEIVRQIEPGVRVVGFAGQIDQVLMNLVTNAAQAIGDRGGTIRIAARREGAAPDDHVVIEVADDGPGIPESVRPRIFDPFFTTKDVGEGSGLGLSIVHGIVERHGGRIEVQSEPGHGTVFRVRLPARLDAAMAAPQASV